MNLTEEAKWKKIAQWHRAWTKRRRKEGMW